MSETRNVGASVPQQATPAGAPRHASQTQTPPGTAAQAEPQVTGWVGWIVFAGAMMVMLGTFHAFQGLIALFRDEYYLVGPNGLTLNIDYTAWGWTHLIGGVIVLAVGVGMLAGQNWARLTGIGVALVSALLNAAFLAAFPVWSSIMIALDVVVIWALTVHGSEMASLRRGTA